MRLVVWFVVAAVLLGVWWRFFRVARPAFPPLVIDENDPLMKEAVQQAKRSIPEFRELYRQRPQQANVKVPLKTSSGVTEFLWAEVLALEGDTLKVRLLTPPVSHTGQLERLQTYNVQDLVDWSVEMDDSRKQGGYTMRVMFKRGREQWGDLPDELKNEERKYVP